MRRSLRLRNPSTPAGTALGVAALAGIGASLYYSFSAMSPTASMSESVKRATIGGGLLIGSLALVAFGGKMIESMGAPAYAR